VGIDPAQIRAGEHVGSLFGVRFWYSEAQEHARAEFVQLLYGKNPGF
jgi:hypothetical protein